MTPKEIFLETIKRDGHPARALKQYEALNVVFNDPINGYLRGNRQRGTNSIDRWGTHIHWPADAPGAMPYVTDETRVIKDMTHWRDYVKAPDLDASCRDGWRECSRQARQKSQKDGTLVTGFMGTGIFEQSHFLLGFDEALADLYEYPDEMHELIEYITEYRLHYVKLLIDGLHPEAILSHDDWGAKDALFFNPDMWREFFKEPYRRFYGYIRSRGVIAIHHSDSYLVPILDDMAEIGIQVWQGALPENNIPEVLDHMDGRLTLMGGIGAAIDREDATEEEIREYTRKTLEADCPHGHFIPCITYGVPGAVYPQVDPVVDDEIDRYNQRMHGSCQNKQPKSASETGKDLPYFDPYHNPDDLASVSGNPFSGNASSHEKNISETGNTTDQPAAPPEKEEEAVNPKELLFRLSQQLRKGRKKKVLQFTEDALAEKIPAQNILSEGLIPGMVQLGEDFSANRAFVPEMLMAARCMTAATDLLKPYLAGEGSADPIGKVVMGTVKGDMHDIGKNLVHLMMEGSGLEVIDLGVDVEPEQFIQTAIDEHCDIIALSSLLTTCMNGMKDVVDQAVDRGIRDHIIIMVGGAPITQDFCNSIGADIYTEDAASAARAAVDVLEKRKSAA